MASYEGDYIERTKYIGFEVKVGFYGDKFKLLQTA